jgi:hypothetical protein
MSRSPVSRNRSSQVSAYDFDVITDAPAPRPVPRPDTTAPVDPARAVKPADGETSAARPAAAAG